MTQPPPDPSWRQYGYEQPPQWAPPTPPPAAKKRRKWPWIVGGAVLLLLVVSVANSGKSSTPATGASSPADPGQAFVKDFRSYPGLTTNMSDADLIGLADKVCDAIGTPGVTYDNLTATISTSKLGPQVAPVLVNTANRSYCPGKRYATSSAPPIQAADNPPAQSSSGPLTTFSDGTYEVGTGDGQVAPGKYKSPGSGGTCYWARLKHNDGALGDIIANNIGEGQMILNVGKSDGYVEVRGCTFTKA